MSNPQSAYLIKELQEIQGKILFNEPMALHTSLRVGGPADIFVVPDSVPDLQCTLKWANKEDLPVFILGAGSNLLVSDNGIRGVVVKLGAGFGKIHIRDDVVTAGAGVLLSSLVRRCAGEGLSGLECLAGIPGTVGGAVCMNAGTPEGCIKDTIGSITALDRKGELETFSPDELQLRYRGSVVCDKGLLVADASFNLTRESPDEINNTLQQMLSKRKRSQPVRARTAGSVFKNPPNGYAGQILESIGAKGMTVGGAKVSDKHANFIENTGKATAEDIHELIIRLQTMAQQKCGIVLEPEIQLVGEW